MIQHWMRNQKRKPQANKVSFDAVHPNTDIARKLERIYALHNIDSDFRLTRSPYNDLLKKLGNPHHHLPPTIHIAGTNGKGSTQAFLKSIYQTAGYKVHAYTSPHLLTFNERITIANDYITDDALIHYLDMMENANDGQAVTFFEYTTALAFKAFADTPADICILETGLGGRLDCTNIIPTAAATIITNIGFDHMDYLGDTIEKIAGEKAGIIKNGVPCIIAPQEFNDVYTVFEDKAKTLNAPLYTTDNTIGQDEISLVGAHQGRNAATAIKAVEVLQNTIKVPQSAIDVGIANTKWPARMECIKGGPIFDMIPDGCELWFDCGHNAQGAKTIGAQFGTWKAKHPNRAIHVVMGLANDKNPNDFIAPFIEKCDTLTCVDLVNARNPQSADSLANKLTPYNAKTASTTREAVDKLNLSKTDIVLVCGSLYLYKEVS
jgi:dihydrofolate synthase/folylpolyglutamate synthase